MKDDQKKVNVQEQLQPLFEKMQKIVDKHVKHFKSDFDIDKDVLTNALMGEKSQRKRYWIWLVRSHGTHIAKEWNAISEGTSEKATLDYFATCSAEDGTLVKSFFIDLEKQTVHHFDYRTYCKFLDSKSFKPEMKQLIFENKIILVPFKEDFYEGKYPKEYGELNEYYPYIDSEDMAAYTNLLLEARKLALGKEIK
ncbi:hypothetical protein M2146_002569 [Lachnospiraceae bacterium PF1-22]